MSEETPWHGLKKWEQNELNWYHNDTVDRVEAEVPKSGLFGDRPSDAPQNARYWARDVRVLFEYSPTHDYADPDGWVPIAGRGVDGNPVPGTAYFENLVADSIDLAEIPGDLTIGDRLGVNMGVGTAPLEIRGNADTGFHIVLHTLDDAGTTAEERAGILFNDDAGNNLANIAAHTHNNGHHFSLYGYDGTGTGFKAFDVESNQEFNFSPDLVHVLVQSQLQAQYEQLTGLVLERTDSPSHRINMVNGDGQNIAIRQTADQLRLLGNDGNQMFHFNTGGPNRSFYGLEMEGDLAVNQNFLTLEDLNNVGSEFETFVNNGTLIVRDPNGSNVLYIDVGGNTTVQRGDLAVPNGAITEQGSRVATRNYVDNATIDSLSVTGWQLIDVSNHGFPGDRSGGDLAQFIDDQMATDGKYVFVLPDGTYEWNRKLDFGSGDATHGATVPDSLAIIGKPEATIHVDIGATEDFRNRLCFEMTTALNRFSLQHLHFDVGDHNADRDAGIMRCQVVERGYFDDISITGRRRWQSGATGADSEKNGDRHTFKLDVVDPQGTAQVNELKFPHGDIYESGADTAGHAIPVSSEPDHVGYTKWTNCYVAGFVDNAYYLRDGTGSNHIADSTAVDCGAGGFRLGRNDRAENITVRAEAADFSACPIWVEEHRDTDPYDVGSEDDTPIVVDGFEIIMTGGATANTAIRCSNDPTETVLKNGYIRVSTDDFIVSASADTGKLTMENITVDDECSGNIRVAAWRLNMDNVTLDNVTHRHNPPTGENGRSILRLDGTNLTVRDSELQGSYYPALEMYSGADVTFENTDFPHDGSYTDPYLIRVNSSPVSRLVMSKCDVSAYTGGFVGSGSISDFDDFQSDTSPGAPSGHLSGYLSTAQSNVEDGATINVFENAEVDDEIYTIGTADQVTVNQAGTYRIKWTIAYQQTSGGTRTCLESFPQISGVNRQEFKGSCYVRNDTSGDRNSSQGEMVTDLASGDTVSIFTQLESGSNNPHDAIAASCTVEYLG